MTTDEIIEVLKNMSLFDAAQLVTKIEETFGVDASTPVGGSIIGIPAQVSTGAPEPVEEKTTFDVILENVESDKRVAVLKVIRALTSLGLKEAKEFTTSLPKAVKESVSKDEAETALKQLEEAGGKAKIV
jgi:large subunit ribosomal protein L7/L12